MFLQVFADDSKKNSQFKLSFNYINNDASEVYSFYLKGAFNMAVGLVQGSQN